MAENDNLVLEDEENLKAKGSSLFSTVVIITLLAAIAGGGYFAYLQLYPQKSNVMPSSNVKPVATGIKSSSSDLKAMVPIRPFVVNLARSKGKRFLKVTLTMELNSPEVNAEVNENMSKIVDSILLLLSSKSFEDVYTVQGKFKLKDEITTRVNRFLVSGHVKDVYFTEFVIQ
ncbi:MAG: flagellar basal body-associated FliL family protein [Nitrospinales bacterium]